MYRLVILSGLIYSVFAFVSDKVESPSSNVNKCPASKKDEEHEELKHKSGYCHIVDLGYVDYATYLDASYTFCYMELFPEDTLHLVWEYYNCPVFPSAFTLISNLTNINCRPEEATQWHECVSMAMDCCKEHTKSEIPKQSQGTCPPTWDGLQCWEKASAGDVVRGKCPMHLTSYCPYYGVAYSEKRCVAQGNLTWEVKWDTCRQAEREFTTYAECYNKSDVISQMVKTRLIIRDVVLAINVIFILPAIVIFLYYERLRENRNIVHVNFLLSHLLSSVLFIIYDILIVYPYRKRMAHNELALDSTETTFMYNGSDLELNMTSEETNGSVGFRDIGCVIFTLFVHKYFMLTKYTWMFCECYYLYRIIINVFKRTPLTRLYLIGWLFPVVPVIVYIVARYLVKGYQNDCWANPAGNLEWILNAFGVASFVFSIIFVAKVLHLIIQKLDEGTLDKIRGLKHFKKTLRAVITMLPLVGFTYFPTFYRPPCYTKGYHQYQIVDNILLGLQGILVAVVFCYRNHEVRKCICRRRGARAFSHSWAFSETYPPSRNASLARGSTTLPPSRAMSLATERASLARGSGELFNGTPHRLHKSNGTDTNESTTV